MMISTTPLVVVEKLNVPPSPTTDVLPPTLPTNDSALRAGAAGVAGIPSAASVSGASGPNEMGYSGGASVAFPASPVSWLELVVPTMS